MIKRISGILRRGKPDAAPGKPGGHGDHWGCIFRQPERQHMLDLIQAAVERGASPDTPRPGLTAYRSAGDAVCACVIVQGQRVVSAYPEVIHGPVWPITLTEIVPWANGLEGQLTGTCEGAAISFFDTRFYANSARYRAGQTYDFGMGALAYRVGLAEEIEAENEQGVKVSFKGARAYMPAPQGEGADIDDYWFHSPLEEEPRVAELDGRALTVYPVILAMPSEFEMRVDLLAAEHALQPGMGEAQTEDDLQGFLWLQGHLVEG